MTRRVTVTTLVLTALTLVASPLLAAEPDLSTPKSAAKAFALAVEKGDDSAVRATSVGSDEQYKSMKIASDLIAAFGRFVDASGKKFGDAGKLPVDVTAPFSSKLDGLDEKVEGDTATLVKKDGAPEKNPLRLTKAGGAWKVDLKALSDDPDFKKIGELGPKLIKALDAVTADVNAGKFKDASEAFTAFGSALSTVDK